MNTPTAYPDGSPALLTQAVDLMQRSENCVLATAGPDGPLCSLMACSVSDDGLHVFMLTARDSHKYRNLLAEPRVSLLFDNRTETADPHKAQAVTAEGVYAPLAPADHQREAERFLDRRPYLAGLGQADSELLRIRLRTLLYLPTPTESAFFEVS